MSQENEKIRPEVHVLKKRQDFLRVAATRKKWVSQSMVVQMAASPDEIIPPGAEEAGLIRVGFTASKKVGNAVMRNRAKRRLREVARKILPEEGRKGFDYVIIARDKLPSQAFDQLIRDFKWCLKRLHADQKPEKDKRERPSGLKRGA